MKRFYRQCPRCPTRMRRFSQDDDGERGFYFCPNCGMLGTLVMYGRGWAKDWPAEVFEEAVRQNVLTPKGRVI